MAALHREGEVLNQNGNGTHIELDVRVPEALLGRLERIPGVRIREPV
jgi:hypothetical protein